MDEFAPEQVVRRYYDALNARDYATAAGAFAEGCEFVSVPSGVRFTGSASILNGLREFAGAFSDWRVEVDRLVASGMDVVVEWRTTGTHDGEFRGALPTGIRFERRGCAVAEVAGGKIVRYRDYYDRATLLEQLGLIDAL
jgi:steroid delta-isomerase-like uncharacterized protein